MGIRVNYCLGYGLTDVRVEGQEIVDDRFDPLGWARTDNELRDEIWTPEGFFTYVKNFDKDATWFHIPFWKEKGWMPYDSVIHDPEYGEPEVFMMLPVDIKQYHRHDDIIDYTLETELYGQIDGPSNRVIPITKPIYPWLDWMDLRTGKTLDNKVFYFRRLLNALRKNGNPLSDTGIYLDRLAQKMGFLTAQEVVANMVPAIPPEIKLLCRFLNLFNDESTIWSLRPMVYIYWG